MENFARRGIRTTVAVAGLAALGVGLAAPTAFALPSVPDISGVGNTQAVPSPTDGAAPAGALGALPGPFRFTPPATEQSTATDAAPSSRAAAEPADEESTESETTEPGESTETTEADESEATEAEPAESTEAAPAATTPAPTTQGLLPSIPGSPVAAQASPQVAGVDPSSALQSLDSGSMF
jgi:cell division protein FtsN